MSDRAALKQSIEYGEVLLVSVELSKKTWRLELAGGLGGRRRQAAVPAWDLGRFERELARAKSRLGLAPDCRVVCCQEAGRDGFSVHRYLVATGVESRVIDPASCEVNRRQRRAKTDGLDTTMLMNHQERYLSGQPRVWRVVRVPTEEAEDRRHLHRELETLKEDRTRLRNRIQSLLATQGIQVKVTRKLVAELEELRRWDGLALPALLCERLKRECRHLLDVEERIALVKGLRQELVEKSAEHPFDQVRHLQRLRAIGPETAWYLVMECFGWRRFANRREVGAYAGLTPTPFNTGQRLREQGIGKDGNARLRAVLIEAAWGWLRLQPESRLSRWFGERFGPGGKRSRRIGIVALARRLLIAMWRYVDQGIIPEGAVLKA